MRPIKRNQQGDGVISDLIDEFFPTRDNYPPKVRKIIADNFNKTITSIVVKRDPVNSLIQKTLNLLSLGKLEQQKKKIKL